MRAVLVLLCAFVSDVRAEGFLSRGGATSGTQPDHAALLEALSGGGCGQPCARVLQSAVDAISNKSAGTVLRFACSGSSRRFITAAVWVCALLCYCMRRLLQDVWLTVFRQLGAKLLYRV